MRCKKIGGQRVRSKICAIALSFALALLPLCGCAPKRLEKTEFALSTVISITVYGGNEELLDECAELCKSYERLWSRTIGTSEIARINAAQGKPVEVSMETASLIKDAAEFCSGSGGALDITIGGVSALWDFGRQVLPDQAEILRGLPTVGYRNISVAGNVVTLSGGAQLDLGAVAKGDIADKLALFLRSRGVKSAVINLGGNVYALGKRPDGKQFNVGIRSPFESGELLGSLLLSDMSVVTSGVYERNFVKNGRFYHHLLDPKTGFPADNGLVSVSIICESSLKADALSTACFVKGLEDGMALAREYGVEAIFVMSDGNIYKTMGVEAMGFTPGQAQKLLVSKG